jgi:putative nucleotidyltransferase with HDIG domain
MQLRQWAFDLARERLADALPMRWAHVQGVARAAQEMIHLNEPDKELLEVAAVLHDVGYAPDVAESGFHPLDGARLLRFLGAPERLCGLVAYHSCATVEARLRGLANELAEFIDEPGAMRDALWCCDLTTSPHGEVVTVHARLDEIVARYGSQHLVSEFIRQARPELLGAVERTQDRLLATQST